MPTTRNMSVCIFPSEGLELVVRGVDQRRNSKEEAQQRPSRSADRADWTFAGKIQRLRTYAGSSFRLCLLQLLISACISRCLICITRTPSWRTFLTPKWQSSNCSIFSTRLSIGSLPSSLWCVLHRNIAHLETWFFVLLMKCLSVPGRTRQVLLAEKVPSSRGAGGDEGILPFRVRFRIWLSCHAALRKPEPEPMPQDTPSSVLWRCSLSVE